MKAIYTIYGLDYQSHYATIEGLCNGLKKRITSRKFIDLVGASYNQGRSFTVKYTRETLLGGYYDSEDITHYIFKTPLDDRRPSQTDLRLTSDEIQKVESALLSI